jgi:hypothetical protein
MVSGRDPIDGVFHFAKHTNPALPPQLAMNFKHAGEGKVQIVLHEKSAAGAWRKNIPLGKFADFLRPESNFGDFRKVQQLGKRGIKIGIGRDPVHMAENVFFAEASSSGAQNKAAVFVDLVIRRHGSRPPMPSRAPDVFE